MNAKTNRTTATNTEVDPTQALGLLSKLTPEQLAEMFSQANFNPMQFKAITGGSQQGLSRDFEDRCKRVKAECQKLCDKAGITLHQMYFEGKAGAGMKGRRLPIKYRGPNGETWTGQGNKPKWMGSRNPEDFRIDASEHEEELELDAAE